MDLSKMTVGGDQQQPGLSRGDNARLRTVHGYFSLATGRPQAMNP
jgi:hypothetical protein